MAEKIDRKQSIKHDTELEVSYGSHIPQPSTVKGDIVVFGDVERQEKAAGRDIVVVVRGPDAALTVRRRDRVARGYSDRR